MRRSTLWRVPLYSIAVGYVCFYLVVYLLGRFAFIHEAGSISIDPIRSLLLYALVFVVVVAGGGLVLFRQMTRREIFWSATIMVALYAVLLVVQLRFPMITVSLAPIYEWTQFPSQLVYRSTGLFWPGIVLQCLAPYCFVPFGQRTKSE